MLLRSIFTVVLLIVSLALVTVAKAESYSDDLISEDESMLDRNPTAAEIEAFAPSAGGNVQKNDAPLKPPLPKASSSKSASSKTPAALAPVQQYSAPSKVVEPLPSALQARADAAARRPLATSARARPVQEGETLAVYLNLKGGSVDDKLVGISSAWAASSSLVGIPSLSLPARAQVRLVPGGVYVMLTKMQRSLRAGQMFPIILNFEKAGAVRVMVQVESN